MTVMARLLASRKDELGGCHALSPGCWGRGKERGSWSKGQTSPQQRQSQDGSLPALLWWDGLPDTHLQGWDRKKWAHLGQRLARQKPHSQNHTAIKHDHAVRKFPLNSAVRRGLLFSGILPSWDRHLLCSRRVSSPHSCPLE